MKPIKDTIDKVRLISISSWKGVWFVIDTNANTDIQDKIDECFNSLTSLSGGGQIYDQLFSTVRLGK